MRHLSRDWGVALIGATLIIGMGLVAYEAGVHNRQDRAHETGDIVMVSPPLSNNELEQGAREVLNSLYFAQIESTSQLNRAKAEIRRLQQNLRQSRCGVGSAAGQLAEQPGESSRSTESQTHSVTNDSDQIL